MYAQIDQKNADELGEGILMSVAQTGEMIAYATARTTGLPYGTIIIRRLKLEAAGLLRSRWYNDKRLYRMVG